MQTCALSGVGSLWQQLAVSPGQPELWLALARAYAADSLPRQMTYASRQALRLDSSLGPQLTALANEPWPDTSSGDALLGRAFLPETASLVARFTARAKQVPGDWLTWLYLARLQAMNTPVRRMLVLTTGERRRP